MLTHRKTLAPISVLPPKVLALARMCTATRARSLDDSSLWARISGNQMSTANLVDLRDARAGAERAARHLLGMPNAETLACSLRTSHKLPRSIHVAFSSSWFCTDYRLTILDLSCSY
ncbi:hypothetical protein BC826DRAFT_1110089 [Russula brevipes]|nr:hypothetical protein BC826DRAFT_1110089 [Russula brevipes]